MKILIGLQNLSRQELEQTATTGFSSLQVTEPETLINLKA